ncbi:MAG TPA: right-handed parallel beta-helix repeat-containing protein [Thermoanaerobaculia bacterium]|nr:right-handed parallel beta-helix repeat-containing protein [Thermoanaerobaculia bacterium]
MRVTKSAFTVFALSALLLAGASVAQAQASRTWVSGTGDDVNPCNRLAPCKTFAGAISKTAAGGQINVMDAGAFGAVTITKALTISAEGFFAGLTTSPGFNVIVVNAGPNDVVVLRGLDIDLLNGGTNAIRFLAGGTLVVEDCILKNGTAKGIDFEPSGNSQLLVKNTTIVGFNNGANGGAILIKPTGAGTAKVALTDVRMTRSTYGLRAENGSMVAMRDSVASNNTNNGVIALSTAGGALDVSIDNSLISGNGIYGVRSEGSAAAIVRISNTTITGNNPGLSAATNGQIISYGDNHNSGNVSNNNGAPTSTIARQ